MVRRFIYIITIVLTAILALQESNAQTPSVYEVTRMSFNSGTFSEISPVLVQDGIIFCSNRRFSGLMDRTSFDGNRLYNIYMAQKKDTSDWRKPVELMSERSSRFNNGPMCLAPDGKTVYFTSEVETGKPSEKRNFKNHSGIFIAELKGTDLISLQPFKYNNLQYDIGQPSISNDGKYLFFAGDLPGGLGKSDLYYCELINGEWALPVNIGPKVNSQGADNYPFMHPSGRLYFTSDRPGGAGKLDVYYTSLINGNWEDPVRLPEPINSMSDDFAFVPAQDLQTGYFSSNRQNSDDIFRFVSTIIRKASCDTLSENSYCYRFIEENAAKFDTIPFRYEWSFGDGERATGAVVEHCYKGPGTYIVQLDAINLISKEVLYDEKTDTLVLTEIEQPYISSPDIANPGQRIVLNADSTNLPGWNIARYYWNFGDETVGIGREIDHSYLKPGIYNIQLIVSEEAEPGGSARETCISKNINVIRQP